MPGDHVRNSVREPSRGTLSLAEGSSLLIGDILVLPRDLQARLAESLDGRVRLIATTAGDPEAALQQEQFRPELYYGLSVLVIPTLPLRQRRHDLLLLAQCLLERANQRTGSTCGGFTPQAVSVLQAYDWPGNLSELVRDRRGSLPHPLPDPGRKGDAPDRHGRPSRFHPRPPGALLSSANRISSDQALG